MLNIVQSMVGARRRLEIYQKCEKVLVLFSVSFVDLSLCKDFPSTKQIYLEQNYRSTASILRCSLAIIAEGKTLV